MFLNCGFSNKIGAKTAPLFGSKLQYFGSFYAGPFYTSPFSAASWKLTPLRADIRRVDKVINLDVDMDTNIQNVIYVVSNT